MTNEERILEYTREHYENANKLIERSLINFYHSRLKEDKTDVEIFQQEQIYEGVLDFFIVLSEKISYELEIDKNEVYEHLKNIHIKT